MPDLIECVSHKLDDPIVMTWALHRYQHVQLQGAQHCQAMEAAWFHYVALRRWIDAGDRAVMETFFRVLPPRLLTKLKPVVVERWSGWDGSLGARAVPVLIACPLEEVLPLLARHLETGLQDVDKTTAVIAALLDLPRSDARRLLDDLTVRVSELPAESVIKAMLSRALLRPTATLNPDALVSLTETCARTVSGDTKAGRRLLRAAYVALFGNDVLMEKAGDLVDRGLGAPFLSLQSLFTSEARLQDCDRILAEPEPWPAARGFLERHRGASAATETALAIADLAQSLDIVDSADAACFAVAAGLQAFERDEIEVGGLSIEQTLDALALDIRDNRHAPSLVQHLASYAPADLARAVNARMPTVLDEWGSMHLATMAGQLRLVETTPTLIDSLAEESADFLCDAAQEALVRIGEPAALALIAQWDRLDRSQRIFGAGVLEQIGGESAGRFAVEHFADLFQSDRETWCALAAAAPSERALDLVEPEVRRRQSSIDECFYLLCVLTGREPVNLGEIRERIVQHRKRVLQRQAALAAGRLLGADDSLTLTLKCEKCNDVNSYDVKSVVVGTKPDFSSFFVRDNLRCVSCGEWADFEPTAETNMQMMAALVIQMADRRAGKDGHSRKGPLQPVEVQYRWERRPAPEVMAEIKVAVAQFPHDVVNHLRLARFQYVFGRYGRAADCYGRALDLEPDSMEAGLGIAHVKADTGERRAAFDRLCEMLDRASKWRFFRADELSPKELTADFTKLFNRLHTELGIRDLPMLRASSVRSNTKVGRNDPCPCGSGKKHKKCCGGAQAAVAH